MLEQDKRPKPNENGQAVLDSNSSTGDDDFDDDSWKFKDASSVARSLESVDNSHPNHEPQVSENGIQPLTMVFEI